MSTTDVNAEPLGPALAARAVWIHGNDLSGPFYRPLAERLAARGVASRLLTLPGFDGEPPLPTPGWRQLVDAALAEATQAPLPSLIVGHSMGGLIALLMAAQQPAWLTRLVLLEPAIFPTRLAAQFAGWRYRRRVVNTAAAVAFDNSNGGMRRVAHLERFPKAAMAAHQRARERGDKATARALFASVQDIYPLPFHQVRVPTLVVRGAQTGMIGRWMAGHAARHLHTTPVVIPDAAHWLANEADAEITSAIVAFLGDALPAADRPR